MALAPAGWKGKGVLMASKDLPYAASGGAEPELNKDGTGSSWVEREGGVDGKQRFTLRYWWRC